MCVCLNIFYFCEIIEHLLFSWLRSVWPWMKVKVNIINTWCILVTEAVTVSNVIAIASLVSEIWLATERHTHTHWQWHRLDQVVYVKTGLNNWKRLESFSGWLKLFTHGTDCTPPAAGKVHAATKSKLQIKDYVLKCPVDIIYYISKSNV